MTDLEKFADILMQRLRGIDRTAKWLADRLKTSPSTVTRWLSGDTRPQDPDTVIRIADVLGIHQREERQRLLELVGYAYVEAASEGKSSVDQAVEENSTSQRNLLQWLPLPTYERLFGIETVCEEVTKYLDLSNHHEIISIQGIGGIGKTALADYAVRSWISNAPNVQDILWVSAKQQGIYQGGITGSKIRINLNTLFNDIGDMLGDEKVLRQPLPQKVKRLAGQFRDKPYLVIIDNLEAVEDFGGLTQLLANLAGPTKFILTSREDVPDLAPVTYVQLNELNKEASLELIEYTAIKKGVDGFKAEDVYKLVGGNPLAIVLAVSQMQEIPPSQILTGIKLGKIEEIYRYVYWNAWHALSPDARKILLTVQRSGNKATWASIKRRTKLAPEELIVSTQQLIRFSLIQPPRPSTETGSYAIHQLTSTFLRAEVLQWR